MTLNSVRNYKYNDRLVASNVTGGSGEGKGWLRDANFYLKHPVHDLRSSRPALKEALIFCSHRAETAKNQMQNFIL